MSSLAIRVPKSRTQLSARKIDIADTKEGLLQLGFTNFSVFLLHFPVETDPGLPVRMRNFSKCFKKISFLFMILLFTEKWNKTSTVVINHIFQ